ncbi:MAG: flagellar hook-length control protein FliK [Desulfuromonadaceae bacterium]
MNTLPFMHHTQTADSSGSSRSARGGRPSADNYGDTGSERTSFEPAMRDAASRTAAKNSPDRNNSNSKAQNSSDLASQEHNKTSGRDEDLAGAAVASQGNNSETRATGERTNADASSARATNGAEQHGSTVESGDNGAELALTKAEKEQLQEHLKAALRLLEDHPSGKKVASQIQDILRSNGIGAANADELPQMKMSDVQTQKLQDILTALKQINDSTQLKSEIADPSQLKGKLADLLSLVEQGMRRAQQNAQVQQNAQAQQGAQAHNVLPLQQPEIVEGFVLRAEKDNDSFNKSGKVDDPRFAALLNKATDFSSLRERQGQSNTQNTDMLSARLAGVNPQEQAQSLIQQARAEMATANTGSNADIGDKGKAVIEGQAQLLSGNASASGTSTGDLMGMKGMAEAATAKDNAAVDFSAAQKGTGIGNNGTDPGVLTLKNGATVPSAKVVDQTIQHLNLHARGDSSVVTVKLYPEELGELNIRMVMEGDQLKLQIQAQNQQVREILEQNFPRLRNAMQDQGVTVEDFQVSLGDSGAENQTGTQSDDELSRRRGADGTTRKAEVDVDELESAENPRQPSRSGGLSVHV